MMPAPKARPKRRITTPGNSEQVQHVTALSSFVCEVDGREYFVRTGAKYLADDPIVKGRRELFEVAR